MLTARDIAIERLEESALARVAGTAARLAGGQEFGPIAQHGAEYAVHRGEHLIRKALEKVKGFSKKKKELCTADSLKEAFDQMAHAASFAIHHNEMHRAHANLAANAEDRGEYSKATHHDTVADMHQKAADHFIAARRAYGASDRATGDHHMTKGRALGDHAHSLQEATETAGDGLPNGDL